jgi:hypothetical protein
MDTDMDTLGQTVNPNPKAKAHTHPTRPVRPHPRPCKTLRNRTGWSFYPARRLLRMRILTTILGLGLEVMVLVEVEVR